MGGSSDSDHVLHQLAKQRRKTRFGAVMSGHLSGSHYQSTQKTGGCLPPRASNLNRRKITERLHTHTARVVAHMLSLNGRAEFVYLNIAAVLNPRLAFLILPYSVCLRSSIGYSGDFCPAAQTIMYATVKTKPPARNPAIKNAISLSISCGIASPITRADQYAQGASRS
jgi:hypothetical protein